MIKPEAIWNVYVTLNWNTQTIPSTPEGWRINQHVEKPLKPKFDCWISYFFKMSNNCSRMIFPSYHSPVFKKKWQYLHQKHPRWKDLSCWRNILIHVSRQLSQGCWEMLIQEFLLVKVTQAEHPKKNRIERIRIGPKSKAFWERERERERERGGRKRERGREGGRERER